MTASIERKVEHGKPPETILEQDQPGSEDQQREA